MICANSFAQKNKKLAIQIFPDSIVNDIGNYPIGINLDYFMDDDKYLKPKIRTADVLKTMGVKYLRYPGGNKSDNYLFSSPPYKKSEPKLARTGKGTAGGREAALNENCTGFNRDVLDFDEFMKMCRKVGAEPVIVVAGDEYDNTIFKYPVGSTWSNREQLIKNAVEWVKYANVKKKYGIKYWLIANETWNDHIKNGASIYAKDVVDFSKAMKAVDPTIKIIPNGNTEQWWATLLPICKDYIDGVCVSNYPLNSNDSTIDLIRPARIAYQSIDKYGTSAQKEKMKVIVAEFGPFNWGKDGSNSFKNTQRNNLINFEITGLQMMEPRIDFSCFWNTRWIDDGGGKYNGFDALDKNGNLNANGYGLMIWGNFHGNKMIKTSSSDNIKAFASTKPSKNKLYVYLLNETEDTVTVELHLKNYSIHKINQAWELKGKSLEDENPAWTKINSKDETTIQQLPGATIQVIECSIEKTGKFLK